MNQGGIDMGTGYQDMKLHSLKDLHCEVRAPREEKDGSLAMVRLQLPWKGLGSQVERNKESLSHWPLWKAAWARTRVGLSGHTVGTDLRYEAIPGFLLVLTMHCPSCQGSVTAEPLWSKMRTLSWHRDSRGPSWGYQSWKPNAVKAHLGMLGLTMEW